MEVVAGPFAAVSLVLLVGGVLKLRRPQVTGRALSAVGLPASHGLVRLLGAVEVTVGGAALAVGSRLPAILVTVAYVVFAAFVVLAISRRVALSSCGCFGKAETPPTVVHVVVNLACAALAATAASGTVPGLAQAVSTQAMGGVPFVLLTATVAYLLYLVLALLPQTTRAARHPGAA